MIISNLSADADDAVAATFSHSIELFEQRNQSDNPFSVRNTREGTKFGILVVEFEMDECKMSSNCV